jgi:hypothetical protein
MELIDRLWDQMVAPRARVHVESADELPQALRTARSALLDGSVQRVDARARASGQHAHEAGHHPMHHQDESQAGHEGLSSEHGEHAPMAAGSPQHVPAEDLGSMDMAHEHHMGHEHHMDMTGPAGIPLAQGEDDRDGLEMDVLHVALGPVLPAWPADLVLRCTLHGDVISSAAADPRPPVRPSNQLGPEERTALLVDAAARVLLLAGWEPAAAALRRVRDDLVSPQVDRGAAVRRLAEVQARVRRSRTLRWSLRGSHVSADPGSGVEVSVHRRLLTLLEQAVSAARGLDLHGSPHGVIESASGPELAAAVTGRDIVTARLIVASLTPWGSTRESSPDAAGGTAHG